MNTKRMSPVDGEEPGDGGHERGLKNASETNPSQAGETACFYTEHKPVKPALSLSLCVVSPLNLPSCNTCVSSF